MNIFLVIIIVVLLVGVGLWLANTTNRPYKDPTYIEIRNMLQETLLPVGFAESETVSLGNIAKYTRDTLLVEFYYDAREGEYSFFASRDVKDPINPPRQISITFLSAEYNFEKKNSIGTALQDWLKTLDNQ